MLSQEKVLPQDLAVDQKRYLSLDKILLTFHICQAANTNAGIKWSQASHLCAICFPSGEVSETAKVVNEDPFAFGARVLLFSYKLSPGRDV